MYSAIKNRACNALFLFFLFWYIINNDMVKYFIFVFLFLLASLLLMQFFIGVPRVYRYPVQETPVPHLYEDASRPIRKITVFAFYFIPKNKAESMIENWQEVLENNLLKLKEFHTLQFQNTSRLAYEMYPAPIIGEEENLFYDTDVTQHGNPEALKNISEEIDRRVFDSAGDLFISDFVRKNNRDYLSRIIMYEGVGASGGSDTALVSRTFLADLRYRAIAASTLAHEFYHTLGIPDAYEIPTSIPTSEDIMGLGRARPIEKTYINRATVKKMGL